MVLAQEADLIMVQVVEVVLELQDLLVLHLLLDPVELDHMLLMLLLVQQPQVMELQVL